MKPFSADTSRMISRVRKIDENAVNNIPPGVNPSDLGPLYVMSREELTAALFAMDIRVKELERRLGI